MTTSALVWFKRDLRTLDHEPLARAASHPTCAAVYIIEPEWLQSNEFDPQHLDFVLQSLNELRSALAARGMPLMVRTGNAVAVLEVLKQELSFTHLLSHEETGSLWTYQRDLAVARWCKVRHVAWTECVHTGVVRRLGSRSGWAGRWAKTMSGPLWACPDRFAGLAPKLEAMPSLATVNVASHSRVIQAGGEKAALQILDEFVSTGAIGYRKAMSSPLSAERGCSRLSAHLAYGTVSMRTVHQASDNAVANARSQDPPNRNLAYGLAGFAGRLRWHCHFMQKLEDEPQIEQHNFSRAFDGLREDQFNRAYFEAWCAGETGYPMVDACMRSLKATGWLNFRMRAMLVSFASNHLWLHWRETGQFLARQFLDFEPGIHWSQMQMQSGTTGINTFRIYSPSKQALDQDPQGEFVRRWVPEFGSDAYPPPIVDEKIAVKFAKERLYTVRGSDDARAVAKQVQEKHGSRKSGLPPSGAHGNESGTTRRAPRSTRTKNTTAADIPAAQQEMF